MTLPGACDATSEDVLRIATVIEADYREMPGMRLTCAQAQRLWNLPSGECTHVLGHLLRVGRLVVNSAGQYCVPHASY